MRSNTLSNGYDFHFGMIWCDFSGYVIRSGRHVPHHHGGEPVVRGRAHRPGRRQSLHAELQGWSRDAREPRATSGTPEHVFLTSGWTLPVDSVLS